MFKQLVFVKVVLFKKFVQKVDFKSFQGQNCFRKISKILLVNVFYLYKQVTKLNLNTIK
jgi:hypothetical protein